MCEVPSWIVDNEGKAHWLTDKDVMGHLETSNPDQAMWECHTGHHAIEHILGVRGKHHECFPCPEGMMQDMLDGKMDHICLANEDFRSWPKETEPILLRLIEKTKDTYQLERMACCPALVDMPEVVGRLILRSVSSGKIAYGTLCNLAGKITTDAHFDLLVEVISTVGYAYKASLIGDLIVYMKTLTSEQLEKLYDLLPADQTYWAQRIAKIDDGRISEAFFRKIVFDKKFYKGVSFDALINPCCPVSLLIEAAHSKRSILREGAAWNRNTPLEELEYLCKSRSAYIQECLARNPSTPEKHLRKLASSTNVNILECLAHNSSTPTDVVEVLAGHSNWRVRDEANATLARRRAQRGELAE